MKMLETASTAVFVDNAEPPKKKYLLFNLWLPGSQIKASSQIKIF